MKRYWDLQLDWSYTVILKILIIPQSSNTENFKNSVTSKSRHVRPRIHQREINVWILQSSNLITSYEFTNIV